VNPSSNKVQTRLAQGKNKVKTPANKVKQGKTKLKIFWDNISPVVGPAANVWQDALCGLHSPGPT